MRKKERHLITSALPYINGVKHLGNLVGSILPADVYAKYLRQEGCEVLYICGTDEHGTPAEIAAQDADLSTEVYCAQMYEVQKDIYQNYGISFDYFGRSSSPSNHAITQEIYLKLKENNYLFEKPIKQYYSKADGRFLPDRYVEGTCYICGYAKARGDQCDGCGALLEPENLINPYSAISGSQDLELKATEHIFIDLSKLQSALQQWVDAQGQWPDVVKGIARKWLKEGLEPRCITRDLKWGIKVPEQGYEQKVFYVWFDAPNAYISITKDWAEEVNMPDKWKEWWLDASVHYTQFMAKDNVPFHAIFWPAVLLASGLKYKKVDYIKGFHWLTYEKGKFSTSQKRGVFTDSALKLYPADYWRYYLIAHCPETSDADFCFTHFAAVINKDLADILGNFCHRTLSLLQKYYHSKVPLELSEEEKDKELVGKASCLVASLEENIKRLKFRNAAQALRALWVLANEYITQKQPWTTVKTSPHKAAVSLVHCLHLLRLSAVVSYPFISYTSQKILGLLNDPSSSRIQILPFEAGLNFTHFSRNHIVSAPEKLFSKIEEPAIQALIKDFSGINSDLKR